MADPLQHIVPGLRPLAIEVSQLVLDPNNARKHDERNLATIRDSLSRFGQRAPIIVQKQGMVVRAGNGRVMASRQLGWTQIAAVVVDEADADAAAFALVDNRSAELAEWDWDQLAATLAELRVDLPGFDVADLGWNDTELAGLELANVWDNIESDRDVLRGTRKNIDRSTLVLRFNSAQASALQSKVQAAGLGETVTPESLMELVARCR